MIRYTKSQREAFLKKQFITCKYCGYNNKIQKLKKNGVCLCCGQILDKKIYFKATYYKTRDLSKTR